MHSKIDSADAERRRLLDLFQAGMIDMTELQRPSRDVTHRHHELTTKRAALATQRAELARGNPMRRRVTDFADRIRTVIDKLDDPNNNSDAPVRLEGPDPTPHFARPTGSRPDRSTSNTQANPSGLNVQRRPFAFPPWSPTDSPTASRKQPPERE